MHKTNTLQENNNTQKSNVSTSTYKKTYERQDVTLLYKDGLFKGYMNIWKNPGKQLQIHKDYPYPQSGLYESISVHFSEFHRDQEIFSTAEMNGVSLKLYCKKKSCNDIYY